MAKWTDQQIKTAINNARAAGDMTSVSKLQNHLSNRQASAPASVSPAQSGSPKWSDQQWTDQQIQKAMGNARKAGDMPAVAKLEQHLTTQRANAFAGGEVEQDGNKAMEFLGGAKHALDKAAYGLANSVAALAGDEFVDSIGPNRQERDTQLAQGKAFVNKASGWANAGELAGDIGIAAVPGGAAYKGVNAATNALKLYRPLSSATKVAGNAAANAGTAAALAPEDKKEAATLAATLGALGDTAVGTYRLAAKGLPAQTFKIKPHAQHLMDQGVNVPLHKAVQSEFLTNAGEAARGFPIAGPIIRAQDDAMLRSYNKYRAKQAMPEQIPVKDPDTGVTRWVNNDVDLPENANLIDALQTQFDDVYNELYRGREIPLSKPGVYDIEKQTEDLLQTARQFHATPADQAFETIAPILRALTKDAKGNREVVETMLINPRTGKPITKTVKEVAGNPNVPARVMNEMMNHAGQAQADLKAQGKHLAAKYLGDFLDILRNARVQAMPEDLAPQLKSVNDRYGKFKLLQKAMSTTSANNSNMVTPGHLATALRAMDRSKDKSVFARSGMPQQADIKKDMEVVGSRLPMVGPGTAEKLGALNTLTNPSLFRSMMEAGIGNFNNLVMGNTGVQRKLAAPLDSQKTMARMLRNALSGVPVGVSQQQH